MDDQMDRPVMYYCQNCHRLITATSAIMTEMRLRGRSMLCPDCQAEAWVTALAQHLPAGDFVSIAPYRADPARALMVTNRINHGGQEHTCMRLISRQQLVNFNGPALQCLLYEMAQNLVVLADRVGEVARKAASST